MVITITSAVLVYLAAYALERRHTHYWPPDDYLRVACGMRREDVRLAYDAPPTCPECRRAWERDGR